MASKSREVIAHGIDIVQLSGIPGREAPDGQQTDKPLHAKFGAFETRGRGEPGKMIFKQRFHARMPQSAERLQASIGGLGQHQVRFFGWSDRGLGDQLIHQRTADQWSIAGDHQPPAFPRIPQGTQNAAERTHVQVCIRKDAVTLELPAVRSEQRDLAAARRQDIEKVREKGLLVPREQRFVAPHSGALAPHQDVAKRHANCMVTFEFEQMLLGKIEYAGKVETNKFLRICLLLLSMTILAHLDLRASESPAAVITSASPAAGKALAPAETNPAGQQRPVTAARRVSTVLVDQETGRLVRVRAGSGVASKASSARDREAIRAARRAAERTPSVKREEIRGLIDETARKHGVDPKLVHSVIRAESNYEQKAISPKGALGLMQLIPATARRYGVENPFDASQNIDGGVRYLKSLTERFRGNLPLALAAYNAGEGAVERHGGIPPYRETREYVRKVTRNLNGGFSGTADTALLGEPAKPSRAEGLESEPAEGDLTRETRIAASRNTAVRMYTDSEGRLHLETIQ